MQDHIYRGGYYSVMRHFESKQMPLTHLEQVLPPEDVDLAQLMRAKVVTPPPLKALPQHHAGIRRHELATALAGHSELVLLHAMLIATLRKSDFPSFALPMFLRIWDEEGPEFVKTLPIRWQISAATTFADHGVTADQRVCGMGLMMLFDMVKMHDSERRMSGRPGSRPYRRSAGIKKPPLAFDMPRYSLSRGDADRNMLARLWRLSERDDTIAPLAQNMLRLVMTDDRSIFARLQTIKARINGK